MATKSCAKEVCIDCDGTPHQTAALSACHGAPSSSIQSVAKSVRIAIESRGDQEIAPERCAGGDSASSYYAQKGYALIVIREPWQQRDCAGEEKCAGRDSASSDYAQKAGQCVRAHITTSGSGAKTASNGNIRTPLEGEFR